MTADSLNPSIPMEHRDGVSDESYSMLSSSDSPKDEKLYEQNYKKVQEESGTLIFQNDFVHKCSYDTLMKLKELGRGQFGTVYKAKCLETNYIMAVKEIPIITKDMRKKAIVDLLTMRETRGCPYIVSYLGCFISNSTFSICMEIMEIGFDKILEKNGAISEIIVVRVVKSTVKALQFLKEHNKLHRDIKPGNILVDVSGHIKMCDFGICGELISTDEAVTNSKGTYIYLAPERLSGQQNYGVHADVWSLGITIYELLTGVHPYAGNFNQFYVHSRIESEPAPRLDGSKFSNEACEFISCCLQKDPKKRLVYKGLMETRFYKASRNVTSATVGEWIDRLLKGTNYND